MKLDDTAKVVAIFSTVITAAIGAAGYVGSLKLNALQTQLARLGTTAKTMEVDKQRYDLSARLMVDFSVPLARSFALQPREGEEATRKVLMPTDALADEFGQVTDRWADRRGLMTGEACRTEGLAARQVVTLLVNNIGSTDADDVRLTVREKASPHADPRLAWQEGGVGYPGLLDASRGWKTTDIALEPLRGLASPAGTRVPLQVVLASVSGTRSLFGTILVPMAISWTDSVSRQRQSLSIYPAHIAELRASLLGAEIGTAGSACR